jgi:AcrR family transcriptional regulator
MAAVLIRNTEDQPHTRFDKHLPDTHRSLVFRPRHGEGATGFWSCMQSATVCSMNAHNPPIRRRQVERSAASTAAMLNAAIELITEQGGKVSMMAIGQRSGFSHGLVLARFGSKAGLIEAVLREAQRRFAEVVDAATVEATGIAKLHCLIDAFFRSPSTVGKAFFLLLGESLGPDPRLRVAFVRADETFRRYVQVMLQKAQTIGEIDPSIGTHAMATLLVGMLRGVSMQYCVNPEAFEIEAIRTEAHAFVARLGESEAKPSCA